ncbi:GNAT family N-acetyltransferase [Microlunatus speluncae]|uniref:GNAT family N-acetyltransferase n=1 Tax=Microlunatus speluncae TaxID=2594267 RepID=UPI0012664042|nr:GNAT family N-acetyltransferase [Microlunatus speluncae]
MKLQFFTDPSEFLAVAGSVLAADPVVGSVVATISERAVRERADGVPPPDGPCWWAVITDGDAVVGLAMRTAPRPPYPMFVLPMPDAAARLLATTLHDRGEHPGGSNGALPAAQVLAEESVRLWGGSTAVEQRTRLFECRAVVPPAAVAGVLRPAEATDLDLVQRWVEAFHVEAAEQAGRDPGTDNGPDPDGVRRQIAAGKLWLFVGPDGAPAHLTGVNPPAFGVSRIGPVYTPKSHRGRGIASHVVAELTARGLAAGTRMCLFTDQANPVSNKVYEAIGYRPVVDMANLIIDAS